MLTRWLSWRVIDEFAMRLDIPPLASTDMTGCLEVATFLMPDVTRIEVYAGGIPDILYKLTATDDGSKWEAVSVRPLGR
jgi:hypothetical protein